MSDGLSDANREVDVTRKIETAAWALSDALEDVEDAVFGYPPGALEIINTALKRRKLKVVIR